MGVKPFKEAQLDRINNDGNYEPSNCRWTTPKIYLRNSSLPKLNTTKVSEIKLIIKEKILSTREIAKKYNVSIQCIYDIKKEKSWSDVKIKNGDINS